jgi:murein DD-endopeptidase MepM/ murein hydrolase activator NlpD
MKLLISFCLVCLPLKHLHINSDFGFRIHPLTGKYIRHEGIDFKARHDTVYAILPGTVRSVGYDDGLGINVHLSHDRIESIYGHLSQIFVAAQQPIAAGEAIGITGSTGRVTGEHLHLSIRYQNRFINPLKFLYELLIKNEHERQKFQTTTGTALQQADRRN